MNLYEAIHSALLTLRTQKLRTFLTLFGMVWGTASVVFLVSWGFGVEKMLEDAMMRVGKNFVQVWPGKIGEDFTPAVDRRELWFTRRDVAILRERSRYADLVVGERRDWQPTTYGAKLLSQSVHGVEPSSLALRGIELASGRTIRPSDMSQRTRVAVLGATARAQLMGARGKLGDFIRIRGLPHEVVGFLEPVGTQLWRSGAAIDEQIWVPLTTFLASAPTFGVDDEVVGSIQLRLSDRKHYDHLKTEIRELISRRVGVSPDDEEAIFIVSPLDMLAKLPTDQMSGLLGILALTTLVVGGIGILNMMLDSVQERRREIGVRMAVGATRRDVVGQFFLETFAITAMGGMLGIALGLAGCELLARAETPDLIPKPILKIEVVILALGVMSGIGFVAGLVPAWRAAGIEPASTLRTD